MNKATLAQLEKIGDYCHELGQKAWDRIRSALIISERMMYTSTPIKNQMEMEIHYTSADLLDDIQDRPHFN